MDTIGQKTPVPLPMPAWQALSPVRAAREVHARIAALPDPLRRAALAWLQPEAELAAELAARETPASPVVGASLLATSTEPVASKLAPTKEPLRPLRGVPCFVKDLFDVAGVPTFAGSTFLPLVRDTPGDSAIVRRLRELGAGIAGKTHLVEFASGLTGENPHYGDCPHPRFPHRLSGGSSSGSAALVAAGVVPLAIGTDTGGSVRVPASWCGVYGFRLTPGDELIRDAFPLSPTMDTAGWFAANAADMQVTLRAMVDGRAKPPAEPWTLPRAMAQPPVRQTQGPGAVEGEASPYPETSGQPRGCYLAGRSLLESFDPAVEAACERAAAKLSAGADSAVEAALRQAWNGAVEAYLAIGMSEAHAVHRDWLAPYHEYYDPAIWQRFTDAGKLPREKIDDARFKLKQVRAAWAEYFRTYDFLILPAVPGPAPTKAECTPELRRNILTLTVPASLGGQPCLTLPVALSDGLTAGVQLIAKEPTSPAFTWALKAVGSM